MAEIIMEVTNGDLWMTQVGHYCTIHSIADGLHSKHRLSDGRKVSAMASHSPCSVAQSSEHACF